MALKRPENLAPGDKIKVWGEDLEVERSAPRPSRTRPGVDVWLVGVVQPLHYLPGVLVDVDPVDPSTAYAGGSDTDDGDDDEAL